MTTRPIAALRAAFLAALLPLAGWADVPRVVTDIGPTASLVAGVMAGLGAPVVLVPSGTDPHHFQLRPSQARDLAQAQAVIWIGPGLTPWLERLIGTTAPEALSVALEDAPGLIHRSPMFAHPADGGAGTAPEGHAHGVEDPHVWLDPTNARAMTAEIAARLAALDPPNAATYAGNAAAVTAALDAAEARARALLAPHQSARLVVFHDGYAHFAGAFGLTIVAALADGEAASPGAAALQGLRRTIAQSGADCLFGEVAQPSGLVASLAKDSGVPSATLDPLAGGELPGAVWVSLAGAIDACLSSD